jgi:hypothetical protein
MIFDAEPSEKGRYLLRRGKKSPTIYSKHAKKDEAPGEARYVTHFATCPKAEKYRKKKKRRGDDERKAT